MTGINTKDVTDLHILESPSQSDRLHNRNEGRSLCAMLELSAIDYTLYDIKDYKSLENAFEKMIEMTRKNKKRIGAVTIHFSMHGDQHGLFLTSGEHINWESFSKLFKKFIPVLGYIPSPFHIDILPLALNFSTCEGLYAVKVNDYSAVQETLFLHVIGPTEKILWQDSLVAFTTFYHNILNHNIKALPAVAKMNIAANLDNIFQINMGKGMTLI